MKTKCIFGRLTKCDHLHVMIIRKLRGRGLGRVTNEQMKKNENNEHGKFKALKDDFTMSNIFVDVVLITVVNAKM